MTHGDTMTRQQQALAGAFRTAASLVEGMTLPPDVEPGKDAPVDYKRGVRAGWRLARTAISDLLARYAAGQYPGVHTLEVKLGFEFNGGCSLPTKLVCRACGQYVWLAQALTTEAGKTSLLLLFAPCPGTPPDVAGKPRECDT